MHSFNGKGSFIHFNSDGSGDAIVTPAHTLPETRVPCRDLLDFAAEFKKREDESALEDADFKTRAAAFWAELKQLEEKYGVVLNHQDRQGAFLISERDDKLPVVNQDGEPTRVVDYLEVAPEASYEKCFEWHDFVGPWSTSGTWEEYVAFLKSKGVEP